MEVKGRLQRDVLLVLHAKVDLSVSNSLEKLCKFQVSHRQLLAKGK